MYVCMYDIVVCAAASTLAAAIVNKKICIKRKRKGVPLSQLHHHFLLPKMEKNETEVGQSRD